jgi:hypothetical protein
VHDLLPREKKHAQHEILSRAVHGLLFGSRLNIRVRSLVAERDECVAKAKPCRDIES